MENPKISFYEKHISNGNLYIFILNLNGLIKPTSSFIQISCINIQHRCIRNLKPV